MGGRGNRRILNGKSGGTVCCVCQVLLSSKSGFESRQLYNPEVNQEIRCSTSMRVEIVCVCVCVCLRAYTLLSDINQTRGRGGKGGLKGKTETDTL